MQSQLGNMLLVYSLYCSSAKTLQELNDAAAAAVADVFVVVAAAAVADVADVFVASAAVA